jgi:hypothetical protein
MYAGSSGGLLYDPVFTWIQFEECTLNLGCAPSVEDNNTFTNGENSMDDSQDLDQGTNRHNF